MFFVFSFVSLFYLCHVFMFFSCGLRASGIPCIWFSIENTFLEDQNLLLFFGSFYFYVFLFLLLFYETCKDMKNSGKCAVFF